MTTSLRTRISVGAVCFLVPFLSLSAPVPAFSQIPGLPAPAQTAQPKAASGGQRGVPAEKSKSAVASASGPITVHQQISDQTLRRFLSRFLPKYPGIRHIDVAVDDGVVTLTGQVSDDDTHDEITDVVKRVEGVRLVMNNLQTDEETMSALEFAARDGKTVVSYLKRSWALIILALGFVVISVLLAHFFATRSETVLAPLIRNVLLRSVAGSVISSLIVVVGLILSLSVLRLTQLVLSIVGVASIVGLAVGFAFRDITENFIASVLLGVRRPFQLGDYITVAGQSGVVKSLNTRATVLVTLEGNHVRIPNSTIFKEIMINSTASPSSRNSFDVVIPNDASVANAIEAINRALKEMKGILAEPPPRALVEELQPDGVKLRVYLWAPSQNADWFALLSEAKLKTKVALQQAGVTGATKVVSTQPTSEREAPRNEAANLKRDAQAAAAAARPQPRENGNGKSTPVDRVLSQPETRVSEEGTNLLG